MTYYPVFLNLKGKKCIVVGGGVVAERKVLKLLKAEASLVVISPDLTTQLKSLKKNDAFVHINREFIEDDLHGAFLVIAATSDEEINKKVFENSPTLVNIVDRPSLCNFIVPSSIHRGDLTLAVSTSGASPALSKTIREELEEIYTNDFSEYLSFLKDLRKRVLSLVSDKGIRKRFLKAVASKDLIDKLRERGLKHLKENINDELNRILKN